MPQSLSQLYVHAIFHVKYNEYLIRPEDDEELYTYIGGVIKLSKSIPIIINGIANHIHVFCIMSKNISLADLMEDIKRNSSRWIKSKGFHYKDFAWQGGYAGFSVSPSKVETVKKYIADQKNHHKQQSFRDEYIQFLNEHGVDYDKKFLWT